MKRIERVRGVVLGSVAVMALAAWGPGWARGEESFVVYPGGEGAGKGKHVVLVSGDEEYRSEEGLPMLGKILSQRHGFKCTVLFAVDADGTINPDNQKSLPGAEALDSADAIVMLTRFRAWPDGAMKHFADAYKRGVPIVALRTSTHAFRGLAGEYAAFNDFGKRVLGEGWVSHWGKHKVEATRGVVETGAEGEAVMRGVEGVFGDSDVYEVYPPADAKVLLRGQVLKGMKEGDAAADYKKKRASDGQEQGVNEPMMPVAWTRVWKNEAGKENRILCTTMGAATDLKSEGLRRLVVNGVYWGLGMEVPGKADVSYVGAYEPTMYGFKGYKKGVRPADHALKGEAGGAGAAVAPLKLGAGEHVAIVGNGLADRMQHHGWFEALVHARFAKENLVVRNLAVAGDEVEVRHRSANFGTPDEWLKKTQADVVFAFFGFNESFKGEAGVAGFKEALHKHLKHLAGQNYSGRGAARVVLFSPIAAERHRDGNFVDPGPINANLEKYVAAMGEVAAKNGVQFVDLFEQSKVLYAEAAKGEGSLTIDGVHLSSEGEKRLAPLMFRGVFGESAPAGDLEKLRAAVNEKNAQWHARYRTVDGYNVYGGRSKLSFPSSQPGKEIDNFHVMQEEMSQRDVLTANRDKRVWAVAGGGDVKVDDSNLPAVSAVPTNKPGPLEEGKHVFLSGEEAITKMKPGAGLKVNLFASEERFPELVNPVQMAWDTRGRLWVSAWINYPERTPTSKVGDQLLVLEDTDGDGRADKSTAFLDDLNCPTGFQFYKDGVLVMQAPDLWFVRDTDGDGKADWKERVLMGMDSADSHHTANSLCYEPGGAIYLSDGVFHRTQVESAWSGAVRNNDAAIYRFEPRTGKFETHIAYAFANPHGRVFEYWGNDIVTDATGNNTYWGPLISGRLDYPRKHPEARQFWERPSRPSPGTGLLTSKHFPEEFQGNLLNMNVIGFQGIYRVKVVEDGSGLRGERLPDLISSEDPNFRPTAVNVGPDGAVYFADWHNPIIGHMQHHLRDPNRDHGHGRIYRITCEGRELAKQPRIEGESIPKLLELLKEPENQTRELAKIELGKRDSSEVVSAVKSWVGKLDKKDPAYEHHVTEALWVHQWHNVVDVELLKRVMGSPEGRARAQGVRVLGYWRDRVPGALAMLAPLANDENARVRLEVARVASFFPSAEAAEIALGVLKRPTDYYIDYVLGETLKQLEPQWREAIASGRGIAKGNPAGLNFLVAGVPTADLFKLPRTESVLSVVLGRTGVTDNERTRALNDLAELRKETRPAVLVGMIEEEGADVAAMTQVARLLPQQLAGELKAVRERLMKLATGGKSAAIRQYAWAAVATGDEKFDRVWEEAKGAGPEAVGDLVAAVPLVYDPFTRNRARDRIVPLLGKEFPKDVASGSTGGVTGRYVRIELPRKGTLCLAEVEVIGADGKNVARSGRARQSSLHDIGRAGRAIDGRTSGKWVDESVTHTENDDPSPWWEVDLRREQQIAAVVVWNRTDEKLGGLLDGFTVRVLDGKRRDVVVMPGNSAPAENVRVELGTEHATAIRRAAIGAAASIGKEQGATFGLLADFIERGELVPAAAAGIRAIPSKAWDAKRAPGLAEALVKWARAVPAAGRTTAEYLSTVQFAEQLVTALPADRAAAVLKDLKELRVAVFVVGTVREQMRYDTSRIVVEAGKPFEILFVNTDMMPHNLTVVAPGKREAVGKAAMGMKPDQLDSAGRAFVPATPDVLAATKMVENGGRESLKLTAPAAEGDYEYVCTYPEHYTVMWGRLVVTKDVDKYLRENPDKPGAKTAGEGHAGHEHKHGG